MKKVLGIIFAAILFAQTATAQEKTAEQILAEADNLMSLIADTTRLPVPEGARVTDYAPTDKETNCMSGFMVLVDGRYYVVTAAHLLPQGNNIIRILGYFNNRPNVREQFELVGYDRRYETVLLQPINESFVFPGRLPRLGNSSLVEITDRVTSLGRPGSLLYPFQAMEGAIQETHFNLEISDLNYTLSTLKHNCAIGEGNSGGPLVNTSGEIIGMNVAATFEHDHESRQINRRATFGYAVPINDIVAILPDLIAGARRD